MARELGINAGFGALGPGWQANAAIGRAVRLVMHNLGGGWPGAVAFAGLGQPGRYTLCLAENEAQSPWAPLQSSGYRPAEHGDVRAETVINVTGGLAEIASVMGTAASGFGILWSGRPTVLIAPAVAADCARRGMSKDDVRRFLWEHGRWSREDWQKSWLTERIVAGRRWPDWVEEAAKAGDIPAARSPDDIVLVVAGGDIPIPQNAYCPSWGFPPACITREVRLPADWTALLADARESCGGPGRKVRSRNVAGTSFDIAVIGGGIAGLTAAHHAALAGVSVAHFIADGMPGGLVMNVGALDGWPAAATVGGAELAAGLLGRNEELGVSLVPSRIDTIEERRARR